MAQAPDAARGPDDAQSRAPADGSFAYGVALVLGRFQPPHNGHIALIAHGLEIARTVIVAIGSSQARDERDNPLSADERAQLLDEALVANGSASCVTKLVLVPDLGDYGRWVDHVRGLVPPFDVVVTGSQVTDQLFRAAGVPVSRMPLSDRERLEGTRIRARLFAGSDVSDSVPPNVARYLGRPEIRARLISIGTRGENDPWRPGAATHEGTSR